MNKIRPTEKQKRAFNLKKEKPDASYKDVMIMSGYSDISAQDPKHNLTETRGYQELLNDYQEKLKKQGLTPDYIAIKLKNLTNSENEDIQIKAIDRVIEGLELKPKNNQGNTTNIQVNYHGMSIEELNTKLNNLLEEVQQLQS